MTVAAREPRTSAAREHVGWAGTFAIGAYVYLVVAGGTGLGELFSDFRAITVIVAGVLILWATVRPAPSPLTQLTAELLQRLSSSRQPRLPQRSCASPSTLP